MTRTMTQITWRSGKILHMVKLFDIFFYIKFGKLKVRRENQDSIIPLKDTNKLIVKDGPLCINSDLIEFNM